MPRTFVIGDIHGCYDELMQLIKQMNVTEEDLLISLGDIVDRGNKSVAVYNYFKNRKNSIVLIGNHELKHQKGILNYAQEIVKLQFGNTYNQFLDWLPTLPYYYETEDAIIVHAFFEHDVSLFHQKKEVLAGTTAGSRYLMEKYGDEIHWNSFYQGTKPIIYGHHVVGNNPKITQNTYGIDTGACHGGMLTAIELPGFKVHKVPVAIDYWKQQQKEWQLIVLKAKDWQALPIPKIKTALEKLKYKEDDEVKAFIADMEQWVSTLEKLPEHIIAKIISLTNTYKQTLGDNFNTEVSKLPYATFIFKAKANKLTLADIAKYTNTPKKLINLATTLKVNNIPTLPI